jgi:hypothetical protein
MRILIYSDVHGNLPAFEAILKAAGPCDQYICLGDLVNYGPWSNECVDLALTLPCSVILMGNHEEAFIEGRYPGSNELVQQFFAKTITDFQRKDAISQFIPEYKLDKYMCRHTIMDMYVYPDTTITLDRDYIIGHSHHQFRYESNNYILYNAGSAGQNRKIINQACYLIYDTDSCEIEMKSALYSFDKLISEMRTRNYPAECIDYYLNKERV